MLYASKYGYLFIICHYSAEYLDSSGLQSNSPVCAEELDFMEQVNQELDLDTSGGSQPEGYIKRLANFYNGLKLKNSQVAFWQQGKKI